MSSLTIPVEARMHPIRLKTLTATAEIHLLGATVTSWKVDGREQIYVSPRATFVPGTPIRGGIPLCFPWFGTPPDHPDWPSHGVARTQLWTLVDQADTPTSSTAVFTLSDTPLTREIWPFPFQFRLTVRIDEAGLHVRFEHTNTHTAALPITGALHTYLRIPGLKGLRIHGLEACSGYSKLADQRFSPGPVDLEHPIDSIFEDAPEKITLHHEEGSVHLLHQTPDAVVWNPGPAGAAKITDLGPDQHHHFICVEAAQTRPSLLEPGERFAIALHLSGEYPTA